MNRCSVTTHNHDTYKIYSIHSQPMETLGYEENCYHRHETYTQFLVKCSQEYECFQDGIPRAFNQVLENSKFNRINIYQWTTNAMQLPQLLLLLVYQRKEFLKTCRKTIA